MPGLKGNSFTHLFILGKMLLSKKKKCCYQQFLMGWRKKYLSLKYLHETDCMKYYCFLCSGIVNKVILLVFPMFLLFALLFISSLDTN